VSRRAWAALVLLAVVVGPFLWAGWFLSCALLAGALSA